MANQPIGGDLHVNRPLTNISVAWVQDQAGFVATQVFPNINVNHQSDQYWEYKRGSFMGRNDVEPRAPGTPSAGTGFETQLAGYYAPVYALHQDIARQTRANADSNFNLDRDATLNITQQMMVNRDQIWANSYFTTSVWSTDVTGVSGAPGAGQVQQWNETGTDPFEDVTGWATDMLESYGIRPNTIVMGQRVMDTLRHHPETHERVKYTQSALNLPPSLLAGAFDVDRVLVASAIASSDEEPVSIDNPTMSFIMGNSLLLCYSTPTPSVLTPTAGYTFSWTGMPGAGGMGNRIKKWYMDETDVDRIEIESAFSMKVVAPELGTFVSGVIA